MATLGLIEYEDASPEVRAVYDDIMATRKTDWINNFWKALAHDPVALRRTWEDVKQIMAPGALDAAHQRNGLPGGERQQSVRILHCVAYGRRAKAGMTDPCSKSSWRWWEWRTKATGWSAATRWKSTSSLKFRRAMHGA